MVALEENSQEANTVVVIASLFNSLTDNRIRIHITTHIIHISLTAKYALNTCRCKTNQIIGILNACHCNKIQIDGWMDGCGQGKQCFLFFYILLKLQCKSVQCQTVAYCWCACSVLSLVNAGYARFQRFTNAFPSAQISQTRAYCLLVSIHLTSMHKLLCFCTLCIVKYDT